MSSYFDELVFVVDGECDQGCHGEGQSQAGQDDQEDGDAVMPVQVCGGYW